MEKKSAVTYAQMLWDVAAVKLQPQQPFTWSSGLKAPIYCDNRITLSFPKVRKSITEGLVALVKTYATSLDMIAGVATAGIAQGVLVADMLQLPFCYVRPEPKKHGLGNQIEGSIAPGAHVVLVEDLISTGGSSLKAAKALQEAGTKVLAVFAIFDYGLPLAETNFKSEKIPYYSLTNFDALTDFCRRNAVFPEEALQSLDAWKKNPLAWSEAWIKGKTF